MITFVADVAGAALGAIGSGTGSSSLDVRYAHQTYRGNVLVMPPVPPAFAWLTGSPFILSTMGWPAVIQLSYVPQTIAFPDWRI